MIDILIYFLALFINSSLLFNSGFNLVSGLAMAIIIKNQEHSRVIGFAIFLGVITELLLFLPIGSVTLGLLLAILANKFVGHLVDLNDFSWLSPKSLLSYWLVVLIMLLVFYTVSGLITTYLSFNRIDLPDYSFKILIESLIGLVWFGLITKYKNVF